MGYLSDYGAGNYGDPGYGVDLSSQAPAVDPYLASLYNYGQPGSFGTPGYGVMNDSPYEAQNYPDLALGTSQGLTMKNLGGLVQGGLSGIGRFLQGVLPGLLGAAQVAQQGLNQPKLGGVDPRTEQGRAMPVDVSAGGNVPVDPLSNYLKLIEGLRSR